MSDGFQLTEEARAALRYYGLVWAKSNDDSGDWFAYAEYGDTTHDYPGSSCEALEDVVEWYHEARRHLHHGTP